MFLSDDFVTAIAITRAYWRRPLHVDILHGKRVKGVPPLTALYVNSGEYDEIKRYDQGMLAHVPKVENPKSYVTSRSTISAKEDPVQLQSTCSILSSLPVLSRNESKEKRTTHQQSVLQPNLRIHILVIIGSCYRIIISLLFCPSQCGNRTLRFVLHTANKGS